MADLQHAFACTSIHAIAFKQAGSADAKTKPMENGWLDRLWEMVAADPRSERALSEAAGLGPNYLQQTRTRGTNPVTNKLLALLDKLGPDAAFYVYTGLRPQNPPAEAVKLISWVSAGQLSDQPTVEGFEDFPTIYAADLPPGRWIALTVDGTSMNKISPPSSVILVNLDDTRLAPNKCYVVADETGAATYKAYDPKADPPFQPRSYVPTDPPVFHGAVRVIGRVHRTMLTM